MFFFSNEHNIPLLYKIQFILNNYSLKSSMNKILSEKIKNIDIWTKAGIKEWYILYKEIEENKNNDISDNILYTKNSVIY